MNPTKKEQRDKVRMILAAMSPEVIKEKSLAAANLLFQQPEYKKAEIVMTFLSLSSEVDTTPICLRGWKDRKRILAPKVSWDQRRMLPIQLNSLSDAVASSNTLGLREPADGVIIPVADIDLVIVPGLAFDPMGNRLGRGRGFFDRFLAHKDYRAVSCALAFEEQFVDHVPVGPSDIPVDILVTDKHVRRFGR